LKTKNNNLIYFIAGEASGDLHGANLIKQFKNQTNDTLIFRGLGGPLMQKEGFTCVENFARLSVMGFYEVLKDLLFFLKLKRKIMKDIITQKPAKIILIDYPGFNLKIAESVKKNTNTKVYYYVSPQLWAWKEKRIDLIKKFVDEMIVIFPFEVEWYQKRGLGVKYFGHPLVDVYSKTTRKPKPNTITIGLFPGSRKQEIKKHLPVMQSIIRYLETYYNTDKRWQNHRLQFIVGILKNSNLTVDWLQTSSASNIKIIRDSFVAFEKCDVAIVASGTATLECAITQTPMVVIYKTSQISWWITKYFINIPFASIVNILANKKIISEYLQSSCIDSCIAKEVIQLQNPDYLDGDITRNEPSRIWQIKNMRTVIEKLGGGTAYKQTANFILKS